MYKKSTNTRVRSEFFSERVITAWNGLAIGTDFRSLARFKNSILATSHQTSPDDPSASSRQLCGTLCLAMYSLVRRKQLSSQD